MPDDSVLDAPAITATGQGTRRRGGGGGSSTPEGAGGRAGSPAGDDFDRLAAMLEKIRDMLYAIIFCDYPIVPDEIGMGLRDVWVQVDSLFQVPIDGLRNEVRPEEWLVLLSRAGLTGQMLRMKETSLDYCLQQSATAVEQYKERRKAKEKKPSRLIRILRRFSPFFEVANSIMGSIPEVIFPGKEAVKEVKEHTHAAVSAAEVGLEEGEEG